MNPIGHHVWWKVYSFIETSKRKSDILKKFLFLDELETDNSSYVSREAFLLLNLKFYLVHGKFFSNKLETRLQKYIILLFKYLQLLKRKVEEKKRKGQGRLVSREIKHTPWKELNSILWIMTQCRAFSSYSEERRMWKSARREEDDPFFIKPSLETIPFRFDNALEMCLVRIKNFIFSKENYSRTESMELLPSDNGIIIVEDDEEEEEEDDNSPRPLVIDSFFNFYFL